MSKSNEFEEAMNRFKKSGGGNFNFKTFFMILGGIFAFWGISTCYYTVQPEEEAVVLRLGRHIGNFGPGPHLKLPFGIDRMIIVKSQTIHEIQFGFRSKSVKGTRTQYSSKGYTLESHMLTGDLNVADVQWVVQYQISDPFKYLFKIKPLNLSRWGSVNYEKNIRDVSESMMRRVVGDKPVSFVLTTGRAEIESEVKVLMQELLNRFDVGIRIVSVKLQDVNPPESVKASFNDVNAAKQEAEKLINEAEKKFNEIIPEARGKAEERVSRAEGYSEAIIARASGDAQRFKSMLATYARAPNITRKRIYIETMQELYKKFDDLIIVDPQVKGLLPVFDKSLKK